MNEQRNYQRITFQTEAALNIAGTSHSCDLVDLALQGALFQTDQELPLTLGQSCDISIHLPDSALTLEFAGELMHQRGQFYGFIFTTEDATTMGHLRRLLELNLGNGEEVDREFQHWLKQA